MSKIDREFDNREYDSSDGEWLEDWMKAESEEISIPESLEPENVAKRLQGVVQNKSRKRDWKKTAMAVAASVAVVGLSVAAFQLGGESDRFSMLADKDESVQENIMQESAVQEDSAQDEMGLDNEIGKEMESDKDSADVVEDKEPAMDFSQTTLNEENAATGICREGIKFQEGNGDCVVAAGSYIYTGEGKELIVSALEEGTVKETTRITMNQDVQAFQYAEGLLACMMSNDGNTTIMVYQTEDPINLQNISTISVEGDYQCSYLEGKILYVFTAAGKVQRVELESGNTITFAFDEMIDEYYVYGDTIYGFLTVDEGTLIREYQFEQGALKKGEEVAGEFTMDTVLAIRRNGANLQFLIKKENAIALTTYDEQLKKIDEKINSIVADDFAGAFTNQGVLLIGIKEQEAFISMMDEENMRTKNSKLLKGIQKIEVGRLWLSDEKSWIGLGVYHQENAAGTYKVYEYSEENGISVVKDSSITWDIPLHELVSGDSVMNAAAGKISVLVE